MNNTTEKHETQENQETQKNQETQENQENQEIPKDDSDSDSDFDEGMDNETLKWRELEKGCIYKVIKIRTVTSKEEKDVKSTIIKLSDDTEVWACSSLVRTLNNKKVKTFPFKIRPTGSHTCARNPKHSYFGCDVSWPKRT